MAPTDGLSVWHLIMEATLVVQFVMLVLVGLSVVSWTVIYGRFRVIGRARAADAAFEERFWSGEDLARLYQQVREAPDPDAPSEAVFRAGFQEFVRLAKTSHDPDAVMEGAQRGMRVALQREQSRLTQHLPFLATAGSTSPYIGLFGTVWGIMNSFLALANVSQASLAIVAPGIAEALIATAMGLFAAIPAVIAYNRYASEADLIIAETEMFAEEFSSVLHRQTHGKRAGA